LIDWKQKLRLPTLGVAAVIVAGWVLLSWRYGAYVLPSPLAVARGFAEIVASGEIWRHTFASLGRILVGFGGAVVVALLTGLAAFLSRTARGVIHDFLSVLNSTSVFVWIVISIIWFGLSNWAPIFTTFMITFPSSPRTSSRASPTSIDGCSRWATPTVSPAGRSFARSSCHRRCPT